MPAYPKPEKREPKAKKPLKRTELKRSTKPIKKGKKPRPISSKKMIINAEYKVIRDEYMGDHPVCEVKGCMQPSEDNHHRAGKIGKLFTDKRYFLAVCRYCHGEIHNNPGKAYEDGYMILRTNK